MGGRVRASVLAVTVVSAGLVPTVQVAQAESLPAPPTVRVGMSARSIRGPESLAAGRYRLQVRAPQHGFGRLQIVKPRPGYTVAQFRHDLVGAEGFPRLRRNTRSFGGVNLHARGTGVMWETLFAGRYWLCGFTTQMQRIPNITTVHVHGIPTASRFPRVTAEATNLERRGVRITRRSIPRTGNLLVRNRSHITNDILFLRLKPGFTYVDYLRFSRSGRGGTPVGIPGRLTQLQSPGAGFVLHYRFEPGRYVVTTIAGLFANAPNLRRLSSPLAVRRR